MTFNFRPLVQAYFDDQRVQSAVDELVTNKFGKGHAEHFEWHEFGAYVDAWLAAQQTAAEWALDLYDIWDLVWGAQLRDPSVVIPRPTAATSTDIEMGDIERAWFGSWYSRAVSTEYGPVGLVVFGDNDGFNLQLEFEKKAPKIALPNWTFDDDEVDGPVVELSRETGSTSLDLSQLLVEANVALRQLALA